MEAETPDELIQERLKLQANLRRLAAQSKDSDSKIMRLTKAMTVLVEEPKKDSSERAAG